MSTRQFSFPRLIVVPLCRGARYQVRNRREKGKDCRFTAQEWIEDVYPRDPVAFPLLR